MSSHRNSQAKLTPLGLICQVQSLKPASQLGIAIYHAQLHERSKGFLAVLPKRLPKQRFDHMLFAVALFLAIVLMLLTYAELMSSYLVAALLTVVNIGAIFFENDTCNIGDGSIEGRNTNTNRMTVNNRTIGMQPLTRQVLLSVPMSMLNWRPFSNSLSAILPLLGRVGSDKVRHDTIASICVTLCSIIYVLLYVLPLLVHEAAGLRRWRRIALVGSVWTAFWFLTAAPLLNESGSATPYSHMAPKRLTDIHFHAPQMSPQSIVFLASQDAVDLDLDRVAAPMFKSDDAIASMPKEPTFGIREIDGDCVHWWFD